MARAGGKAGKETAVDAGQGQGQAREIFSWTIKLK